MRSRPSCIFASLIPSLCCSAGCYDGSGGAGRRDGALADHPYGEFFEASPQTRAECDLRACSGSPNLVNAEGGGGGYACEDQEYELLVVNCGDVAADGSFTVAHFEGDAVDPARKMGESAPVSAGLPPDWAVWVQLTIPAELWPEKSPEELGSFDQVQVVDPEDGVAECNEEDNALQIGGWKTTCQDR